MNRREWKPGDLATAQITTRSDDRRVVIRTHHEHYTWQIVGEEGGLTDNVVVGLRPVVVIDPEDRKTLERFAAWTADGDFAPWRIEWVQKFLLSLIPATEMVVPDGPIVHAVMYRDHKMGTLCNSGAWGTPELFTAVTEHVTCPSCREKLDGARAAS